MASLLEYFSAHRWQKWAIIATNLWWHLAYYQFPSFLPRHYSAPFSLPSRKLLHSRHHNLITSILRVRFFATVTIADLSLETVPLIPLVIIRRNLNIIQIFKDVWLQLQSVAWLAMRFFIWFQLFLGCTVIRTEKAMVKPNHMLGEWRRSWLYKEELWLWESGLLLIADTLGPSQSRWPSESADARLWAVRR